MRRLLGLIVVLLPLFFAFNAFQKPAVQPEDLLRGAWEKTDRAGEQVLLFVDAYFTHTRYNSEKKIFGETSGGPYSLADNKIKINYEFHTGNKDKVGRQTAYPFRVRGNTLSISINGLEERWTRVDEGNSGLAGSWQITARQQEGRLLPIHQSGTRKTVKVLTGTRFQWVAIDPGTKQFMGTGGGTYTFRDGKYTERILFFSRDSSRVGQSLSFTGKLETNDWHHSGLSSRGEPIYEVWSRKK